MKKIFVVDDQEEVRELVEITLRAEDYEILQAENSKEAIEITYAEKPDLIIMDIMMPGDIDGLSAARTIKNDSKTKETKIIMLTAKGQTSDLDKGFEVEVDSYFTKPFSPLDFKKKVEEVLG